MKKKTLAIILCISILIAFTGCNQNELSFYSTLKGMQSLDNFTFAGAVSAELDSLTMDAETFEDSIFQDYAETPEELTEMLQQYISSYAITYDGVVSKEDNKIALNIGLRDLIGEADMNLISLMAIDTTIYVLKDSVDMMLPEEEVPAELETIDGIEYYSITFEEIADMMVSMLEENLYSEPNTYTDAEFPEESVAYTDGYSMGFYDGSDDGFVGDDTQPSYNPQAELYYTDSNDIADFEEGYELGFDDGYTAGEMSKTEADENMAEIVAAKDLFLEKADVNYLIETIRSITFKTTDEFIKNFFNELSLDIVEKTGDSQYTLSLDTETLFDTVSSILVYLVDNNQQIIPSVKAIVTSLSDDELTFIGINPAQKQDVLDMLDEIDLSEGTDTNEIIAEIQEELSGIKEEVAESVEMNYDLVLEKTGKESYEMGNVFSLKTIDEEMPIQFGLSITEELTINGSDIGDIGTIAKVVSITEDGAVITLDVDDKDAVEVGILVSTSTDFTNAKTIKAVKNADGTYTVDLTGLDLGTTYYYKTYTVDASGNTLYSTEIGQFIPAEETADLGTSVALLALLGTVTLAGIVLVKKRSFLPVK